MTSARTDAAQYAGRISVCNPATLPIRFLCGARRRLCSGKTGLPPGLSRLRGQHAAAVPCWGTPTRSRRRLSMGWTASLVRAPLCVVVGRHRQCGLADRRGRTPSGARVGSCEHFRESFAAALTGDQYAAVSERPCDGAADPGMASEPRVSVPHGPLECEGQLITTTPSLDVDQLIAVQATESDRSGPPSIASATRERDDRNRRATALKLLPHSLPSRQLAAPRVEPSRMRSRGLTTGRRVARLAGQRLAARARPLSPAARGMHCQRRTQAPASRVPMLAAARGRGRRAVRAPLIQPRAAVAHDRSCAPAPRARSQISSPFFWREPTLATPGLHLVAASCGPANGRWGESRGERRPRVRGLGWPALTHPRGVAQRLANSRASR
jgi:hypothetical protein